MISVYTKTGDSGESGLANGVRLPKSDAIFDVLGTLDELNAHVGLCVVSTKSVHLLLDIQDTLFHVGAEIAGSAKTKFDPKKIPILEKEIDRLQTEMGENWYQKFLLPGGCESAGRLDIARTVCRRCERVVIQYSQDHEISPTIRQYLNRLSDYLYVLRCAENLRSGKKESVFTVKESSTQQSHLSSSE